MANSKKYLNHLLQRTEITPACSEEERTAADVIAHIFTDHGFTPEVQEFTASSSRKTVTAIAGIALFVATILMGLGGALGVFGFLLALAVGILFVLIRMGKISVPSIGANGLSQNVIAYHQASGPLASPRNRPVVVVAHYDSSRADLLSREPFSNYRSIINKLFPVAMVLPAVVAVLRLLPLPSVLKAVLWVVAILFSLIPLLRSVAFLFDHFAMPYTTGAICNKSSVAAMLGVMDAVAPSSRTEKFPEDVPFEEYLESLNNAYQSSYTADAAEEVNESLPQGDFDAIGFDEVEEEISTPLPVAAQDENDDIVKQPELEDVAEDEPVHDVDESPVEEAVVDGPSSEDDDAAAAFLADEEVPAAAVLPFNIAGNLRFGTDAIRSLGMLPVECELEYDDAQFPAVEPAAVAADQAVVAPVDEAPSVAELVEDSIEEAPVSSAVETPVDKAAAPAPAVVPTSPVVPAPVADHVTAAPAPAVVPITPSIFDDEVTEEEEALAIPAFVTELGEGEQGEANEATADEQVVLDEQPVGQAVAEEVADASQTSIVPPIPDELVEEQPMDAVHTSVVPPIPDGLVEDHSLDASQTSVVAPIPDELVEDQPLDASRTSIVPPIPDELVEDNPQPADAEEQPVVFTGIEDFEEIIPTDDMEVVEADFELVEDEPLSFDEDDQSDAGDIEVVDDAPENEDESEGEQKVPAPDETVSVDMAQMLDEQDSDAQEDVDAVSGDAVEGAPIDSTQAFVPADSAHVGGTQAMPTQPQGTQAMPAQPQGGTQAMPAQVETVDSLMAQIAPQVTPAPRPQRQINIPSLNSTPSSPISTMPSAVQIPPVTPTVPVNPPANRASLFDLPDPSSKPVDPFSSIPAPVDMDQPVAAKPTFTVIDSSDAVAPAAPQQIETIHAVAPVSAAPTKKRRGLFGRKKKEETSMSDWLGVDEDFDAKRSGRDIGSWDNFEGDDGWKGGAAGEGSEDELRQAVTSLGDDELLGHDIWFVATGASENDNAGMEAFLNEHRDKLRGVFIINLKCIGAGQLSMVTTEGERRTLKADRRITGLFSRVSSDFHRPLASVEMPYVDTDAHVAMERSLRAMTLAGIEGSSFACAYTEQDHPINLNTDNITYATDLVTEVIRRS